MRHIVITFAFSLLVISAYGGTYVDNFEDGDFDGWEAIDYKSQGGQWAVENGVLTCRRPSLWYSLLRFGEGGWRNYSIECDAKMVQTLNAMHSIGLVLRLPKEIEGESARPYVDFSLWENKTANIAVWTSKVNLTQLNIASKGFGFQIDQWYHLKAVANEEDFEFYIDEELLVSLSDARAPSGFVSLEAGGVIAHFDNIVITGDDIPGNTSKAVVSSSGKLAASWGQLRIE